jgi:hypothetical protein
MTGGLKGNLVVMVPFLYNPTKSLFHESEGSNQPELVDCLHILLA